MPEEPVLLSDLLEWVQRPVDLVLPDGKSLVPKDSLRAHVLDVAKRMSPDTAVHTVYCMFAAHPALPGTFVGSPIDGVLTRNRLTEILTECTMPVAMPNLLRTPSNMMRRAESSADEETHVLGRSETDRGVFE